MEGIIPPPLLLFSCCLMLIGTRKMYTNAFSFLELIYKIGQSFFNQNVLFFSNISSEEGQVKHFNIKIQNIFLLGQKSLFFLLGLFHLGI